MAIIREEEKKGTKAGPFLLLFGLGGALAGVLYWATSAKAEKPPPPGTNLMGTVTDAETGNPIPGVLVTMDGMQFFTDNSGNYAFVDIELGSYNISFDKPGYALEKFTSVPIVEGDNYLDAELTRLALPVIDAGGVSSGYANRRLSRFGSILYATYLKQVNGADEVFVAFSLDEGESWSRDQVTGPSSPGAGNKGSPSIAVDNNGDLCLVYGFGGHIYYDVLSGGSWLGPQQVNDSLNDSAGHGEILIDSLNNPHVIYLSDRGAGYGEWGKCYVRHAENPPIWSKTDFAAIGTGGGGAVSPGRFAVALNSLDRLELIWAYAVNGGMGVGWRPLCRYIGSKESKVLSTTTGVYGSPVDIAVDSSDGIVLIWGSNLQYYGATLGLIEVIGTATGQVSVAVTDSDRIYLIWSKPGATKYPQKYNLMLAQRGSGPGGILHGGEFLTDVEDQNQAPCLLWAKNPGYCQVDTYAVTWERETADQILFGSPEFFEPLIGA